MPVPKERIDEYYRLVKRHLESKRIWERTIKRFPERELAVYRLVQKILERLDEWNIDPMEFDWEAEFENLQYYEKTDDFLADLEAKGKLPISKAEQLKEQTSRLEGQIMSLIEEAKELSPEILKRVRTRIAETLGQVEELDRLILEIGNLKEQARRERAKAREYKAKLATYEKELRKLYEEMSTLRKQLEEAKKAQKRYVYKMVTLKAVSHIPSFIGADMKIYGPFETGQVFNVPEKDAYNLISRGLAQPWKATFAPPKAPKAEIEVKTKRLWEEYINATLSYEPRKAMEAARQLRELRKQLFT